MFRSLPRLLALAATLSVAACSSDPTPVPSTDTGTGTGTDTGTGDTGVTDTGTDTVVDPCEGLVLCDAEGISCDGDTLVDCAANADGCLIATDTDCTADGQVCDADAGACVDDGGCEDDCDAEGTACDGDSIASCFVGADGCLDIEITVCEDGTCVDGDDGPVCEGATDPCEGLELCDEEGTYCEGGDIITCTANDDACIVREVTACDVGTECSDAGDELTCEPLCEDDAACTEESASCDGTVLNTCVIGALGCLELAADDCAVLADGGTCNAETTLCEAPGDPCADVDPACNPEDAGASRCEGSLYNVCTVDVFGCGVVEMTECGDVDGGYCGDTGCEVVEPGACDEIDAEIVCDEEGALSCGELGPIECQRDADGCLTLVDAGECGDEEACVDGVCTGGCDDVVECEAASFCDEADLVICGVVEGCFVEVERSTCDFGCDGAGEAPVCAEGEPCEEFGCDSAFDVSFCDGSLIYDCLPAPELECDLYEATDCADTEGFTCVDGGFVVACEADPCGDGFFDGFIGEECDDFNTEDGDGCSSTCTLEEGFDCEIVDGTSVCAAVICGDGIVNDEEGCDDEGTTADDGCDDVCAVEEGYECTGEPSFCLVPVCGDGVRNGDDSCDDGNLVDGDGCTSECFIELSDGVSDTVTIDAALTLDDAQYDRIGAFSDPCEGTGDPDHYYDVFTVVNPLDAPIEVLIDAVWSDDGYLHIFSSDFDPDLPTDACLTGDDDFDGRFGSRIDSFVAEPATSYFIVASTFSPAETIDEYTITITTVGCGDGFLGALDECDDGNTDAADGCSDVCVVEDTFDCDGEPSYCWIPDVCGGGLVDGDEECDDYNTEDGDGCSATCTVEDEFYCSGAPSVCVRAICGDGVLAPNETCDDANSIDGDGCSAACAVEIGADDTLEVSGSIDASDPVVLRAASNCGSISTTSAYHDVLAFVNVDDASVDIVATAAWSGDGYLHAYSGFDPADSTLECLDGSDDFGGTSGSQVLFTIDGLSSFELVASTYGSTTATGAYTITLEALATPLEP